MSEAQTKSVRDLENLYSIVIGLGLWHAIINLIDTTRETLPIKLESVPFFLAFLVTLIPFYHGSLRHLEMAYVESGGNRVRTGALLGDFIILFIESCLLLAVAILLPKPRFFAWGLAILLGLDAIWGFSVYQVFSGKVKLEAELCWAKINILAFLVLVIYLVTTGIFLRKADGGQPELPIVIPLVSVVRTGFDYLLCWGFYFPASSARDK